MRIEDTHSDGSLGTKRPDLHPTALTPNGYFQEKRGKLQLEITHIGPVGVQQVRAFSCKYDDQNRSARIRKVERKNGFLQAVL